jgi:hypothetical protein
MNCRYCGRRLDPAETEPFCTDGCNRLAPLEVKRIERRLGGLEVKRIERTIALAGQRRELTALKREIRRDERRLLELLAEPPR